MSSSRRADAAPHRASGLAGWSLRTRLLATVVGLVAIVCVLVGVATEIAVYRFQVGQLDNRLQAAVGRSQNAYGPPPGHRDDESPDFLQAQGPGTLVMYTKNGIIDYASFLDPDSSARHTIPDAQQRTLAQLPINGRPYTRDLGPLGDYRLRAARTPDSDVITTGLPLTDVYATRNQLIVVEVLAGLAAMILAGSAGTLIVRSTLRPLRRMAATAGRVAELPLDRGEVALAVRVPEADTDPRTEVGQVGAALNRMLGHVAAALSARQASETRLRHFIADASHELRTPLAAIRGYAELTRRVRDRVPADVVHAMGRVESETSRMTVLVDDMLLLARLDSGRPLAQDPVDLSRLVIDAVSDARVAGPEQRWQLDLPDEPVTVTGDAVRLHQVLANLLTNARTHTPAGTTVVTSLGVDETHATVSVADNGPGIPPDLLPVVFDRFARGDTSRSRAAGSTGLGLAIVAAVVAANGGTVEATSVRGRTELSVRLPLTVTPQPVQSSGTGAAATLPP
jgi:two-component system OmpR family sensor kinase